MMEIIFRGLAVFLSGLQVAGWLETRELAAAAPQQQGQPQPETRDTRTSSSATTGALPAASLLKYPHSRRYAFLTGCLDR